MKKQEFLSQGVDILRAELLAMFEDPNGELAEMTKQPLIAFAKENWDHIKESLASRVDTAPEDEGDDAATPEEMAEVAGTDEPESPEEIAAAVLPPEEVEEAPLDLEPEPTADESVATPDESEEDEDSWQGNPGTNLHTGAPGNVEQRVGTRDLA